MLALYALQLPNDPALMGGEHSNTRVGAAGTKGNAYIAVVNLPIETIGRLGTLPLLLWWLLMAVGVLAGMISPVQTADGGFRGNGVLAAKTACVRIMDP